MIEVSSFQFTYLIPKEDLLYLKEDKSNKRYYVMLKQNGLVEIRNVEYEKLYNQLQELKGSDKE